MTRPGRLRFHQRRLDLLRLDHLPGPALRGLLAGACVALLVSVVTVAPAGRATWPSLLVGAALVAWVVASPGSSAPTVLLLLAVAVVLDAGAPPWPLLAVQAACLSAVHVLAALCALAPADVRWEVAALVPALRRWLAVQAAVLPVVVLAASLVAAVPAGSLGPGLDVAAGLLGLALVVGLVALARRRSHGQI